MTTTPNQTTRQEISGELLPCPFCGGEGHLWPVIMPFDADCDTITVQCSQCDAIGANVLVDQGVHDQSDLPGLEAEAITAWNTRVAIPGQAVLNTYLSDPEMADAPGFVLERPDPETGDGWKATRLDLWRGQGTAWRPIESAPKDGTPILAFGPLPGCNADDHGWHGVRETKWKCYPKGSPGYAAYERGEGPLGIGWDWYESVHNWSHSWKPTHWMPLPEAPAHLSRSIVGEGE
jgi:hypothetical protein